jgi:glycosyltransferase involved in cell wall biosynthesis
MVNHPFMPLLSVIVPSFNRASLIGTTLASLVRQIGPAGEIIVVDDGSTDGTAAVAEAFGGPVRVLRQANTGPSAARNLGFSASTGEYVLFFDSDDLLAPGSIESALARLRETGADVGVGRRIRARIGSEGIVPTSPVIQQHGLPQGDDLIYWLLTHWSISPHQLLFRREAALRAGGFPEDLWVAEDQEFFLRALIAGARAVWCPDFFMIYRDDNTDKLSESALSRKIGDWAKFLLRARSLCLAAGERDPMEWFGYRLRLWKAFEDLRDIPARAGLRQEIEALPGIVSRRSVYHLAHRLGTLMGGLNQRLFGNRNHACFRAGKPTPAQLRLIGQSLPSTS